jgi:integrase
MASIRQRGSSFQVMYRANGKQTSETFGTIDEAKAFRDGLTKPVDAVAGSKRGHVTVAGYVYDVIEGHSVRQTTKDGYRYAAAHLVAGLGGTCVKDLTASQCRKFVAEFGASRSASLTAQVLKVLRLMVKVAMLDGHLGKDVTAGIKIEKSRVREHVVITPESYRAILTALPVFYCLMIEFLASTGLRWGEMAGLKSDCIVERNGRWFIRVQRTIAEVGPALKPVLREHGKTAHAQREVSVPAQMAARLLANADADGWVFRALQGGYLPRARFRKVWVKATAAVGVPGATVHGLRHLHVSVLLAEGKPLLAISKRVGHSDMQVTAGVYAHLLGDDDPILDVLERFAATEEAA